MSYFHMFFLPRFKLHIPTKTTMRCYTYMCTLCNLYTLFSYNLWHARFDMQDLNCSDYEIECNHKPSMCTVQVESSTLFFYRPIVDRFCVSMFALRLGLTIHIILHMWICYSTYICIPVQCRYNLYMHVYRHILLAECMEYAHFSPFYGVNRGFVAQGFFQLTRNMSGSVHALWHASCSLELWRCGCVEGTNCKSSLQVIFFRSQIGIDSELCAILFSPFWWSVCN